MSERANEVLRKLMEHRAGVLSYSVRNMEKKIVPAVSSSYDSGYDSNRSTMMSPIHTSVTGTSVASSRPKFDGAHFFAGHADAIVPKKQLSPEAAALEIASLEIKLKAAADSLVTASKQQAELTRELSMVQLENQEAETMMSLELQTAEETILAMERELPRLEGLDAEVQELLQEKEEWEAERSRLEERGRQVESLQARIADLETRSSEAAGTEKLLAEVRGESQQQLEQQLEQKDREMQELLEKWEAEKEEWKQERSDLEDSRRDGFQELREEMERMRSNDEAALQQVDQELNEGMAALQQMIREHGIVLFSRESTLKALLEAVGSHLETVHSKLEGYKHAEADWSAAKRVLEEDVRAGLDKREALARELESVRRERDLAKRETRSLKVGVLVLDYYNFTDTSLNRRLRHLVRRPSSSRDLLCPTSLPARVPMSTKSWRLSYPSGLYSLHQKPGQPNSVSIILVHIVQIHLYLPNPVYRPCPISMFALSKPSTVVVAVGMPFPAHPVHPSRPQVLA